MDTIKPALCYGIGTKRDYGYNFYASVGADVFRKDYNIRVHEYQFTQNDDYNIFILRSAARKRKCPIICITSEYKTSVEIVAKEFPDIHFVLFHAIIHLPNVQSIVFDSRGGTFLVGMAAGMVTKSNIIGVSLIDYDFSHRDVSGFLKGIQFVNKKAILLKKMMVGALGDYCNFDAGYSAAMEQIAAGADIIFTPINQANHGALLATKNTNQLYIGSYLNQNHTHPGGVLTSFVFYLNKVVYDILSEAVAGKWQAGVKYLSLEDGVFDWALDRFNCELISAGMAARINQARRDIVYRTLTGF